MTILASENGSIIGIINPCRPGGHHRQWHRNRSRQVSSSHVSPFGG